MTEDQDVIERLRAFEGYEVDTRTLLDNTRERGQRRRRRATVGAVTLAVVGAGIVAVVGPIFERPPHAAKNDVVSVTAATSVSELSPTYLPPGAALVTDRRDPNGEGRVREWSLPGDANANTVPAPPATVEPGQHPATTVQLSWVPSNPLTEAELIKLLPPADANFGFSREVRTVRGQRVVVTTDMKAVLQRLDWFEGGRIYTLRCDSLFTREGRSGITLAELVRVAEGLTPD